MGWWETNFWIHAWDFDVLQDLIWNTPWQKTCGFLDIFQDWLPTIQGWIPWGWIFSRRIGSQPWRNFGALGLVFWCNMSELSTWNANFLAFQAVGIRCLEKNFPQKKRQFQFRWPKIFESDQLVVTGSPKKPRFGGLKKWRNWGIWTGWCFFKRFFHQNNYVGLDR